MNEREVGELRRRLTPDKTTITHIRGCYVNEKKELVSEFDQGIGVLSPEEGEKLLALLKKALSGSLGKNLHDLSYTTAQVAGGAEHKLLTAIRDGKADEETLRGFYQKIADSVTLETGFLILLATDTYDVPFKGKDDRVMEEGSDTQFRYVLCSIAPLKLAKPALTYAVTASEFHNRAADWLVGTAELGFLFPAFDDRATNLYGAMYYCRSLSENYAAFVENVLGAQAPMAVTEQKENFQSILAQSLEEECSMETVSAVRDQLCAMLQEHKESKEPVPLTVTKSTVQGVLASCGVSEPKVEAFGEQYEEVFGDTDLTPRNVVDTKHLEVKTPNVVIKVDPERSDLVETRVISGVKYIMIRADEGVELNGVNLQIEE